jgi:hypothetical protein
MLRATEQNQTEGNSEGDSTMNVPRDATAAALLERWQALEERKTPLSEKRIARLRKQIDQWVNQPPVKPEASRVIALRDRNIDRVEHPVEDVVAWLDEIAAIDRGPLQFAINGETRVGVVLSEERKVTLKFGPLAANGLRAAWSRFPFQETYVEGDIVNSSLVLQNATDEVIEFSCPYSLDFIVDWNVKAESGREIVAITTWYTGSIPLLTWRLKPGEVAEIGGQMVAIGGGESRSSVHVPPSTVLHAQRGEQVSAKWKVREPVRMTTGDVSFKVIGVEDVPVWSTSGAGKWKLPGEVTVEVNAELFHATDLSTTAVLTWPRDDVGDTARHSISLATDFFANRDPWMLAWERDATVLWLLKGDAQSSMDFHRVSPTPKSIHRIDFSDPKKIAQLQWNYLPASVPEPIRQEFAKRFLPLATTSSTPLHAEPYSITSRAADIRPVSELLTGTWQSEGGEMKVRLVFSKVASDALACTMTFSPKPGSVITVDNLRMKETPEDGSIRLIKDYSSGSVPMGAMLGQLKRGIGNTLLLDTMEHEAFPGIENSHGFVLMQQSSPEATGIPVESTDSNDPVSDEPNKSPSTDAAAPVPVHKDARAVYEEWQRYTRSNGDIPGALVGELAAAVKTFIHYNPTWETVPKLNAILPRLDATHDWKPKDAIALLDEVAGIPDSPLQPAPWKGTRRTIRQGDTLPEKYADALWGDEQPSGLRAAWLLEPSATEHRIGSALKARLLVQNRGKVPVMIQVPTFHQGGVKATDAQGAEVEVPGIEWTTMAMLTSVRLAPGEYIEINTTGVGIGPGAGMGPWAGPRIGSSVLANAGDELTITRSPLPLDGSEVGISEDDPHVSGPGWWLAHIQTRLNRELPLPADAAERTRMLNRAVRELFGTVPTSEETAEFIADNSPDAVEALAKRLATRTDLVSFSGKLPTAPVKFRVLDRASCSVPVSIRCHLRLRREAMPH